MKLKAVNAINFIVFGATIAAVGVGLVIEAGIMFYKHKREK